jgi:hypothetical protein
MLLSCATMKTSETAADLLGMVYNTDRAPVQDALVELIINDKVTATTKTDIKGHFTLPNVAFGDIRLRLTNENYETLDWSFVFSSPTQIVYAKLTNINELLDEAAQHIHLREWAPANDCLTRIYAVSPQNVIAHYLEAVLIDRQGSPERAALLLEDLCAGGEASFTIELTAADIYQNELGQPKKALEHLRRAIKIKDDLDIEERIALLEKNSPQP